MFMEELEQTAITTNDFQPRVWLRYVDDTFVVWQHSQDKLQLFLEHLNGLQSRIQFTMHQEKDGNIPFLDVGVSRQPDGSLAQKIYRKLTHTDRYLHCRSFHHPSIRRSVNNTLVRRAYRICEGDNLREEIQHIEAALLRNGYSRGQIKTQDPRGRHTQGPPSEESPSVTLPYLGSTSHKIQRALSKYNVKVFHTAPNKIRNLTQTHKDRQDPDSRPGVYRIPCACGKVYIGETGRNLPTRLNEHRAHGRKGDYDKSGIIKHSHEKDHVILWNDANLITNIEKWHPHRVREAIEIYKHDTVPQDIGVHISDI